MRKLLPFGLVVCACGGAEEIDLVLENRTQANIATADGCDAFFRVFDANDTQVSVVNRCSGGSSDRAFAPTICTDTVRWIIPGETRTERWGGYTFDNANCVSARKGSYSLQMCYGTETATMADPTFGGVTNTVVVNPTCRKTSFELGVDLEARVIAE